MKRIGIAASKIAKGNTVLYNFYVVLISLLFSLFMFIISGTTVLLALVVIGYFGNALASYDFDAHWFSTLKVCMVALTVVIGMFNLIAIILNIRIRRIKRNGR